jgi:uncharacterized damage-inducible protein DinB
MAASLLSTYQTFSRYNRKANDALYTACAKLTPEEAGASRPRYFNSIIGALNHILVMDRIWLDRFTGSDEEPPGPDEILYPDFEELWAARRAEDERMEELVQSLTPALLASRFRYRDTMGELRHDPADLLVTHMFNHQTHHRSLVQAMLSETSIEAPCLELHRIIRP